MIEELNFDDIVAPEEIPATLEEAVAEQVAAVADDAETVDTAADEEDLEEFEGFEIDLEELDKITSDVELAEDEDITSLFDSFFTE